MYTIKTKVIMIETKDAVLKNVDSRLGKLLDDLNLNITNIKEKVDSIYNREEPKKEGSQLKDNSPSIHLASIHLVENLNLKLDTLGVFNLKLYNIYEQLTTII